MQLLSRLQSRICCRPESDIVAKAPTQARCALRRTVLYHRRGFHRTLEPSIWEDLAETAVNGAHHPWKIPQGLVSDLAPLAGATNPAGYPTVIQQAKDNMQKYYDCVILTRVGGFYELYLSQAEKWGPPLNLKVARKKTLAGPVAMAGFPHFHLNRYLKLLVHDFQTNVAISEEFRPQPEERVRTGGLMFERKVVRVISPGTLLDEDLLEPWENNFVCSIASSAAVDSINEASAPPETSSISLDIAWADISTGESLSQDCRLDELLTTLARISPRELVIEESLRPTLKEIVAHCSCPTAYQTLYDAPQSSEDQSQGTPMLNDHSNHSYAFRLLLGFLEMHFPASALHVSSPQQYQPSEVLMIDRHTMRALELKETYSTNSARGSLLHAIRRTRTRGGARLLTSRMNGPSTSPEVINHRLDLVDTMIRHPRIAHALAEALSSSVDIQRLMQKFMMRRAGIEELKGVLKILSCFDKILTILLQLDGNDRQEAGSPYQSKASDPNVSLEHSAIRERPMLQDRLKLEKLRELKGKLEGSIGEWAPIKAPNVVPTAFEADPDELSTDSAKTHDCVETDDRYQEAPENRPHTLKRSASKRLHHLHEQLDLLHTQKPQLASRLQSELQAPSLILKWTPSLGYVGHLRGRDARNIVGARPGVHVINSNKTTRTLYLPEWTALGTGIDSLQASIRIAEDEILSLLCERVRHCVDSILLNGAVLDEIDVACSSARLAVENDLVRPVLQQNRDLKVIQGRHMVVEKHLVEDGRRFLPNDCQLDRRGSLWFITGPNMGGKSTFLRQNAIIIILAQMGAYVPAQYAEIGIVDRLFARIGSSDDLSRGHSSFMLEMLEVAQILAQATPSSFVIMDEVGRGTTPKDGSAIAYGCLEHLRLKTQCRTLFASHFHDVADRANGMDGVAHYCTDIIEDSTGGFSFSHRLQRGINRQSHALKTAKLAGIPAAVLDTASVLLKS